MTLLVNGAKHKCLPSISRGHFWYLDGDYHHRRELEEKPDFHGKSIDDVIHRNKLKLFGSACKKNVSKGKQQLASLKLMWDSYHGST